jgi:hypothetical protein
MPLRTSPGEHHPRRIPGAPLDVLAMTDGIRAAVAPEGRPYDVDRRRLGA